MGLSEGGAGGRAVSGGFREVCGGGEERGGESGMRFEGLLCARLWMVEECEGRLEGGWDGKRDWRLVRLLEAAEGVCSISFGSLSRLLAPFSRQNYASALIAEPKCSTRLGGI